MENIADRIRNNETSLGGPNRILPALVDFLRLTIKVSESEVLVAVYGNAKVGFSASPQTDFSDFRLIRRSPVAETLEYYSVKKSTIGG